MANNAPPPRSPNWRLWRSLATLIFLGLAVYLLVPQFTTLENSWSVISGLLWWAVTLAVGAQALSYIGSGYTLHAILATNQQTLSVVKGILITMASASIGLVAGGWVGGAAATIGWVRRETREGSTAALAGTLPAMLNNTILVGVALIGTAYLLAVHDLGQTQLIEFGVVLLVLGLAAFGLVAALRSPSRATALFLPPARLWAKLRRQSFEPEATVGTVERFIGVWNSLGAGKWHRPLVGALANLGFDILTLYFLFLAAGYRVNPGVLLAGYGLPFILGKMAFLFPGGVGVMEVTMVALYDSLQVPNEVSVVVILGYRLLSFWLPSLLGFLAAAYLSRFSSRAPGQPA